MLNIIYSEILKLKKTNCILMVLITSLLMVIIMNIAIFITNDKKRTFESYAYNIGQVNSTMVFLMIFCIMAAYVFVREDNDKTSSTLYSYPFSRIKIFLGKLFVIYLMITAVYFIQCISTYLSYYKLFGNLEKDQIMLNIKVNAYAMLFQMSSIPIVIFIGNLKRNIIIPIGYEILVVIINGLCDNRYISQIKYNPFIGSASVFKYFYVHDNLELSNMAVASVIFFLISMSICVYHFYKTDIH